MSHPLTTHILPVAALATLVAAPLQAHHGFGLFQVSTEVHYEGTITGIDFVNPHSYLYFDRTNANGNVINMRCEMRAATLLRRSGWSKDMFEVGLPVSVDANPHRDDPSACYTENITIGDRPTMNRNDQFTIDNPVDTTNRALTAANGDPKISGDWAVEQLVLTVPPSGGRGSMVPKRFREGYADGSITLDDIRAANPQPSRPQYTARGQAEAQAFEMWNPEHNPRLKCLPTSIIYDWTFDWPVNRITQEGDMVILDYGLYSKRRIISLGMDSHPANLTPSNTGHSIGLWEKDPATGKATLVVDTTGFEAGVLSPPTRNSDQMHVTERFTIDTSNWVLTREYTVTDPVYLAEPWSASDTVYLSEVPYENHGCLELTPEFAE